MLLDFCQPFVRKSIVTQVAVLEIVAGYHDLQNHVDAVVSQAVLSKGNVIDFVVLLIPVG